MSYRTQKLIAILLALWLPLFSGNALAVSVSMQLSGMIMQDEQMSPETCHDMDMHDQYPGTAHPTCADCGVCHLACSGYLGAQEIKKIEILQSAILVTPYLFSFHSITSTPLVPPPLV